jgi:flagellar protein FlgJ
VKPLTSMLPSARAADALAADGRSLDGLRRQASGDPRQAIRSAARQFEAMFMQMVLKSMREATAKAGLLDSSAGEMYTGMLDQQLASSMSGRAGLAEMIERQLARAVPSASPDSAGGEGVRGDRAVRPSASAAGADAMARTAGSRSDTSAIPGDSTAWAARDGGADASAARAPTGIGDATVQSVFVNRMWDHALVAQRDTGLPAKFIIGQAALESGWGQREIAGAGGVRSFNLFGIKATGGWQGRTVEAVTTEYDNGVPVRRLEKFRAYNNYAEAFRDWARLLVANPRYAGVLAQRTDAAGFAQGLQRAGYATDPNYGAKLRQVIETAQALRRLG